MGFGKVGTVGKVMLDSGGNAAWGTVGKGVVGRGGTVAWGTVGIAGIGGIVSLGIEGTVCRRWRAARVMWMLESSDNAKIRGRIKLR